MKLFHFYRVEDQSGVSGTGPVVEGVQFTNGWCALRWLSKKSSVCFYQSIDDVKAIHGHGGKTEIIIHDFGTPERRKTPVEEANFDLLMQVIEETSRIVNLAEEPDTDSTAVHASIARIKSLLDGFERSFRGTGSGRAA